MASAKLTTTRKQCACDHHHHARIARVRQRPWIGLGTGWRLHDALPSFCTCLFFFLRLLIERQNRVWQTELDERWTGGAEPTAANVQDQAAAAAGVAGNTLVRCRMPRSKPSRSRGLASASQPITPPWQEESFMGGRAGQGREDRDPARIALRRCPETNQSAPGAGGKDPLTGKPAGQCGLVSPSGSACMHAGSRG